MANNQPSFFGSKNLEKLKKNRETTFRKDSEINDLIKEMQRMGYSAFREAFGQEMVNEIKKLAEQEKKIVPIKNKIRLQANIKYDFPLCEKCINYKGFQSGDIPCPWDKESYEKNITFETGEVHNPFPVEICDKFVWVKKT